MQVTVTYSVQVCHLNAHIKGCVASWTEDARMNVKYIRAFRYKGCGDGRIHYEASIDGKEWLRLLKQKQTTKAKKLLPVVDNFPNKTHLRWRGLREEAKYLSPIFEV